MAFQVSPGVQVNEVDATNVVPAVSTSIGGFVGAFNWGPVDEVVTVSSEMLKSWLNLLAVKLVHLDTFFQNVAIQRPIKILT